VVLFMFFLLLLLIHAYSSMRDGYTRMGQGFFCVYSITSKPSFEQAIKFREQILRVKDRDKVPMVLVGNKSDLEYERQVTKMEGQALSRDFACPFIEASAKGNSNVEESFFELVRQVRKTGDRGTDKYKKKNGKCVLI